MNLEESLTEFNRSKIYEKLDYVSEPKNYISHVPWVVQNQIAATNGIHYVDRIGKLTEYPVYELPVKRITGEKLMLDIGCGWGRWLVAGANKNYLPVGVDIRLEFCETSLKVLEDLNKPGYVVVGDLEELPFKENIFDLVWSFSVIQHTHYKRLINCLQSINSILTNDGFTYLEFPNKNGLRNKRGPVIGSEIKKDDYNSWCVRYYSINEYEKIFNTYLSNFSYTNHSFLGIGVLKDDLKYVSLKNKALCAISLLSSSLTRIIPKLKNYSDSLYIRAEKMGITTNKKKLISTFYNLHNANPKDNLNIISLVKCPKYGGDLTLSDDRKKVISLEAGIYYPVINNIPILIKSEANSF